MPHHPLMKLPVSEQDEKHAIDAMTDRFRDIITLLGENVQREGLVKTPERAAKAFYFLTRGYRQDISALINEAVFTSDTDEMVIVKNIEMYSMCEHHMLPFIGKCNVAYLPNGKVLGLSKIAANGRLDALRDLLGQYLLDLQPARVVIDNAGNF